MKPRSRRIMIMTGNLAVGGGAQGVAATLCNQLVARGHQTHLLTFYHLPNAHPVDGIYHSFDEKLEPSWFAKFWKLIQRGWRIRKLWRKHNIELTISFLEEANFCALVSKILFSPRMATIVSVRTNALKKKPIERLFIRLLYPFAKSVVSVSRGVEETLQKNFGLSNTVAIYNPVDEASVREKADQPLPQEHRWIQGRAPLFISIGRLGKMKGYWHLIRAFQKVRQHCPTATLLILGEGDRQGEIEGLISQCGLGNSVFLLGNQNNVYPFLKASGYFVMTSLWEGLPNALLEALAVGLPVLSTDCSYGPREILAPGLPIEAKLSYPYKTSYGTLVAPGSEEEHYLPMERLPLSREEESLAEQMIEFGEGKNVSMFTKEVLERFRMEDILSQWQKIF